MSVSVKPGLAINCQLLSFVHKVVFQCLSMSVSVPQCLSVFVGVSLCLSVSVSVKLCLTMNCSLMSFVHKLSVSVCQCLSVYVSVSVQWPGIELSATVICP